jgi:hypothetical protein
MSETELNRFRQDYSPDVLTGLAMLYLALPYFIFFLGWFKWPLGLLLGAVTALGLSRPLAMAFATRPQARILEPRILLIIVFVAICWSALGGAGHFFFANFDWDIRDAVLRDLVVSAWPPGYGQSGQGDIILRAPVAYYLPAAVFGWALGLQFADLALWFWTALGTGLFLALLPLPFKLSFRLLVSLCLVILFSGMDILGWLTVRQAPPSLGEHLEWWALFFQYSSNTTQLFWVPNHALPAWIAIAIFFRHWKNPEFYNFVPITLALLPLWSPFAAIGISPFYLAWLFSCHRHIKWFPSVWGPAICLLAFTVPYLTLDLLSVAAQAPSALDDIGPDVFITLTVAFILFEFLLLWSMLLHKGDMLLLAVTGTVLIILPFFHLGPSNDLVMRASIPALMMLCILTLQAIRNFSGFSSGQQLRLILGLALGAVTPLQEFIRAVGNERWSPRLDLSLYEAAGGSLPPHYSATLDQGCLKALLREPSASLIQ